MTEAGGENVELSTPGPGLRSGIDAESNCATTAENKPVYRFPVDACSGVNLT
jgi:hypothetical protein